MSMQAIKDVKLNVRPIYIDMSHLYVYEGPCRFGKGEELTYEFDRAMNEENNKRFLQDIRDHAPEWMNVLEPVYVYRNDDWRIPEEKIILSEKDTRHPLLRDFVSPFEYNENLYKS